MDSVIVGDPEQTAMWGLAGLILVGLGVIGIEAAFGVGPAESMMYVWLLGTASVGRIFAYVGAGGVYVTELSIGMAYYCLGLAILLRSGKLERVRSLRHLCFAAFVLAVIAALQIVRGVAAHGFPAIQDSVLLGYVVFIGLPVLALKNQSGLRRMVGVIIAAGIVAGIVYSVAKGLVFAGGVDAAQLQRSLASQVSSTFIGVALLLVLVLWAHRLGPPTWLTLLLSVLLATAIVVGEARSSWLGIAVGVCYLMVSTGARARVRLITALTTSAFVVVPVLALLALVTGFDLFGLLRDEVVSVFDFGRTTELNASGANAEFRLLILADGLARFLSQPWIGEGFGAGGFVHERGSELVETSFHNSHLAILVRTGVVGYAAFAAVLVTWWKTCRIARPSDGGNVREYATMLGIKASLVFMLVSFSFFHALEAPYVGPFFWLMLGLGAAIAADARARSAVRHGS